jgi:hypothetical protein
MGEDTEFSKEEMRESDQAKWAKKLGMKCDVNEKTLKLALEELSESCYGDSSNAKKIIEELTLSCHFDEKEMEKLLKTVSKSCPIDAKELHKQIVDTNGNKAEAWRAISKTYQRTM